ncbi:hypothetical protein [Paractinoplanes durhamensis]|uniref:Uncharacterized protein n=1 Tax=Paractinoplanes durhamensis TaxID=113563 RepID=A0ABQ3Z0Q9_9ACTN|nr:hypothetical protein [Actinoplanes durhamensis]GIE03424.1 hypothetical protein Adu01nite_47740 [Actinoplanes durhamensis]
MTNASPDLPAVDENGDGWITAWLSPGDLYRGEPLTHEQGGIELYDGSIFVDNRRGLARLGHALVQHFDPPEAVVYIATTDTRHYSWTGIGATADEARDALMAAWHAHAEDTGADPQLLRRDELNLLRGPYGQGFRDHTALPHQRATTRPRHPRTPPANTRRNPSMTTTILVAVLVPADTTVHTIDVHLATSMHLLTPNRYRLGGAFTGAWDPDYDPRTDPANWRPCTTCTATGHLADTRCPDCADTDSTGRRPGTVLAYDDRWIRHPGDLIPLHRLLDPQWRFPTGEHLVPARATTAPDLYVDGFHGLRWLQATTSGEISAGLRAVLHAVVTDRTRPGTDAASDLSGWQLAVVAADITDAEKYAAMPGIGSIVLITDPAHREPDAHPDQLYVVRDDFGAPDHYDLIRHGGVGPYVPGHAIAEIDPARVRLDPAPEHAPPYTPRPPATH